MTRFHIRRRPFTALSTFWQEDEAKWENFKGNKMIEHLKRKVCSDQTITRGSVIYGQRKGLNESGTASQCGLKAQKTLFKLYIPENHTSDFLNYFSLNQDRSNPSQQFSNRYKKTAYLPLWV